ncbi:hypothetical protein Tco_1109272, partial [Tanacetum coccineum]
MKMSIRDENGVRYDNEEVASQFLKHFEGFLGKSVQVDNIEDNVGIFKNKISNEEALLMVRPVSDAEIKNAMFDIEDSKAPGPDGFTA